MTRLLDTDTCIHLLRGNKSVVKQAQFHSPVDLAVSAITRYELLYGMELCPAEWRKKESAKIMRLLEHIRILPFTSDTSAHAALLRAGLDKEGQPIGPMNVLIAATALEHDLPLVTNNLAEFQRVPGLSCETWCK